MSYFVINDENFEIYAMKAYTAPCLSVTEFYDDLKRVKYVKRLLNRYHRTGNLKERLILNHIILLGNVFTPEHAIKILFYRVDRSMWGDLRTFLEHLGWMPEYIHHIDNEPIRSKSIDINTEINKILKRYE